MFYYTNTELTFCSEDWMKVWITSREASYSCSVLYLTVVALTTGALSLSAFAPSLGGLWGMLSIQAHILASARAEKQRHRQSIHRFPNISTNSKKTLQQMNNNKSKRDCKQWTQIRVTQRERKYESLVYDSTPNKNPKLKSPSKCVESGLQGSMQWQWLPPPPAWLL